MATATRSLPKIGSNYPLPNTPRGQFAQGVALHTGLNPWVVYAWTAAENRDDRSVGRRPFNFLNVKSYDGKGSVHVGHSVNCDPATDGGCFPGFASVNDAIANTVWTIQHDFPTIRRSANKGAGPQLDAIGHSNWGTSSSTLRSVYNRILVDLYKGITDPVASKPGAQGGAGVTLPGDNTPLPANPAFGAGGLGGFFDSIASFVSALNMIFTLGFWRRAGQVVAGGVLILAGAFVLARGEIPSVAAAVAR